MNLISTLLQAPSWGAKSAAAVLSSARSPRELRGSEFRLKQLRLLPNRPPKLLPGKQSRLLQPKRPSAAFLQSKLWLPLKVHAGCSIQL